MLGFIGDNLLKNILNIINFHRGALDRHAATLAALDPNAVLQRGYSITRTRPGGEIVRTAAALSMGSGLEVILAEGAIEAEVTRVKP
jgi:exodeoxyribonuclease VII large subunit